jgi:TrmH family RNA methyltransferase
VSSPPTIVLVEPQDIVNIASAVRIGKNFGVSLVRLVNPGEFDPYRIEGIAHGTGDVVARIRTFPSLSAAIADCVYAVALTARERTAKRTLLRPPAAARELVARGAAGLVACVFGREDKGLTNEELDHCHALCGIPTNPSHRSLNLGQAVAIMAYECWIAREGPDPPRKPPRRRAGPARAADLDRLFHDWRRTLWAVDFFKTRNAAHVMRSLREVFFRADLDAREAKLLRAMALEAIHYLERRGVAVDLPPDLRRPGGSTGPAPEAP